MNAPEKSTPEEASPTAVSVSEAARMLSVSPATVYRMIGEGALSTVRVRGKMFVPVAALRLLVAAPPERAGKKKRAGR